MTTAEARWKMSCVISSLLLAVSPARGDYMIKKNNNTLTNIRFKSVQDTFRCEYPHTSVVSLQCEVHLQVRSNQDSVPFSL